MRELASKAWVKIVGWAQVVAGALLALAEIAHEFFQSLDIHLVLPFLSPDVAAAVLAISGIVTLIVSWWGSKREKGE